MFKHQISFPYLLLNLFCLNAKSSVSKCRNESLCLNILSVDCGNFGKINGKQCLIGESLYKLPYLHP